VLECASELKSSGRYNISSQTNTLRRNAMFDAKELLNVLTGGQSGTGSTASDLNAALERGKKTATEAAKQAASVVSSALGQAEAKLQGTEAGEYAGKAKEIVDQNPVGTAAVLGGLAAVLLGTQRGRAVTGGAIKLGGLTAIGGIAYKALQNYREGKPLTQGVPGLEQLTAAPEGTAFTEQAHTNDSALLLIRTMVATAAADGVVDPSQRVQIVGELKEAGLDAEAAHFLDSEIQHPATVADISKAVGPSKDLALQVYAAAHLIAASPPEKAFLDDLGKALTLDPALIAHVNASAAELLPPSHGF
jgi:uncharacterized membrane protein YebE (DUF533 family)